MRSPISYYKAIGHALYISARYAEANDYIINYLMMSRISKEKNNAGIASDLIQCNALLGYQAESKRSTSSTYNARLEPVISDTALCGLE